MSQTFWPFRAILSLGFAAVCGGGEVTRAVATPTTPKIDACALLTPEEIEAVVGWKPVKSEPSTYGGTSVCNIYGPKGMTQSVALLVAPGMPPVKSSAEMAQWRKKQTEGYGDIKFVIEPIEGLGVPAIRNEVGENTGLVSIEVAAKGVLLDVTCSTLEEAKALAAKAITRLP